MRFWHTDSSERHTGGPESAPCQGVVKARRKSFLSPHGSAEILPHGKSAETAVPRVISQFRSTSSRGPAVFWHTADRLSSPLDQNSRFSTGCKIPSVCSRTERKPPTRAAPGVRTQSLYWVRTTIRYRKRPGPTTTLPLARFAFSCQPANNGVTASSASSASAPVADKTSSVHRLRASTTRTPPH
jgi:hypothetical protein